MLRSSMSPRTPFKWQAINFIPAGANNIMLDIYLRSYLLFTTSKFPIPSFAHSIVKADVWGVSLWVHWASFGIS